MRLQLLLSFLLLLSLSTHTALAQVVAPSQGGEVGLVLVTATTMELTFGTTGNGQGRVVAMAPTSGGMPVPLAATDGTFYTGSAAYGQGSALGQGYVVYNGPDHAATVTGLKPGTYYYVTDAEYNANATTIAYNTYGISISASTRPAPITSVAPLPVELTRFTGAVDTRNLATLHWTTATEQRTAYFALERSTDGVTFTEIGRTSAAGTSTQSINYQYLDEQSLKLLTYYRLRQVDQNGAATYSQAISLQPSLAVNVIRAVEVYPNPSAGQTIQLQLQGYSGEPLHLNLTDALGRSILTQNLVPNASNYHMPLLLPAGLASGTYIVTLAGSNAPIQKRIIVSN